MKTNKIEDIYPLTIISMRYGPFIILEASSIYSCVSYVEEVCETTMEAIEYMQDKWPHIKFGIGSTINEAFEDFKIKYNG